MQLHAVLHHSNREALAFMPREEVTSIYLTSFVKKKGGAVIVDNGEMGGMEGDGYIQEVGLIFIVDARQLSSVIHLTPSAKFYR